MNYEYKLQEYSNKSVQEKQIFKEQAKQANYSNLLNKRC